MAKSHSWLPFWWWYACKKCGELKQVDSNVETDCPESNSKVDRSCEWSIPQPVKPEEYMP